MIVAKFGGSSLADVGCFERVISIIKNNGIKVVLVSAPGGKIKITDLLISAYRAWEESGRVECDELELAFDRLKGIAQNVGLKIDSRISSIRSAINGGAGYDYTVSRGEYLTAKILASALNYNFVDALDCVKLTMDGEVDLRSTIAHSEAIKLPCVIPGFYGKMPSGLIKLLPRGGSDISGAAIAAAVGDEYHKWTDVDGVFDGHGGVIKNLSYDEAERLCYFGASVMHYKSMALLKGRGVRLTVKNTFSEAKGTVIGSNPCAGYAISSKEMYLSKGVPLIELRSIIQQGLKIPFYAKLMGSERALIDGNGFSPLALSRILTCDGIERVTATATVGKAPPLTANGDLLFRDEIGEIYLSALST